MSSRTYAITGSASGLGAETRRLLIEQGHRVIGLDLRDAEVCVDLSDAADRRQAIESVEDFSAGRVDALIACAGVGGGTGRPEPIVRVNYFGAVDVLEGLRPLLARSDEPRAVAVTSVATLGAAADDPVVRACLDDDEERAVAAAVRAGGTSGTAAYAASKRALSIWTRRRAPDREWAGSGIALNAVGPGLIATPMTDYLLAPERRAQSESDVPMPLGGVGEPRHVASLLAWLTSIDNGRVTGQVIFVDGGYEVLRRGEDIW